MPPHAGWMFKRPVGKWKQRYFALAEGRLEMYAAESMKMSLVSVKVASHGRSGSMVLIAQGSMRVTGGVLARLPEDDAKVVFQVR